MTTQISDRLEVIFDGASRQAEPVGESPAAAEGERAAGGRDARPLPAEPGKGTAEAGGRPMFTITEAATSCGVSRKTITRKLADLATHGAAKDDDGIWRIPVEALLAVGLHPGRSLPEPASSAARVPAAAPVPRAGGAASVPPGPEMISVPRDRWDDLRIRLARAEAEASERALALADARLALRALTAAPTPPPVPAAASGPGAFGIPILADPGDPGAGSASVAGPSVPTEQPGGPVQHPPRDPAPAPAPSAAPAATSSADPVAQARSQAAQTGGHVPAAGAPPARKRRWWHAKA